MTTGYDVFFVVSYAFHRKLDCHLHNCNTKYFQICLAMLVRLRLKGSSQLGMGPISQSFCNLPTFPVWFYVTL